MNTFKLGNKVTWRSQAGGSWKTKTGVVTVVVPPNVSFQNACHKVGLTHKLSKRKNAYGLSRNHESYGVLVGKKLYWPLVSKLQLADGISNPVTSASGTPNKVDLKKLTKIAIVVDRSGSMQSLLPAAIEHLNSLVTTLKKEATTDTWLEVWDFGSDVRHTWQGWLPTVKTFTRSDIYISGLTALRDATNRASESIRDKEVSKDYKNIGYLVMVITDGYENSSVMSAERFKRFIQEHQKTDQWTFTFAVPDENGKRELERQGVPAGNIITWHVSEQGLRDYSHTASVSAQNYYTTRSAGKTATNSFYSDLSNVSKEDLQNKLTDITKQANHWKVEKGEQKIEEFFNTRPGNISKNRTYVPGTCYYALTKTEVIQPDKNIIIEEKKTKKLYTGSAAKEMLGITDLTCNARVKPGNHSDYNVYVQSNSLNRKLVRGTTLLHWEETCLPLLEGSQSGL